MQFLNVIIEKLLSRKLWVAIGTTIGYDMGAVSQESVYVAIAYIIGQALVDAAKAWKHG